jgi:hypothetical protein
VKELSELQSEAVKSVAIQQNPSLSQLPPATAAATAAQPISTDPAVLADLIGTLKHRVEQLERRSEQAAASREKSNEAVTRTLKQLACGGVAGAVARTTVAPLDRVKILKQTQFISYVFPSHLSVAFVHTFIVSNDCT